MTGLYTHLCIILDRSGSMQSIRDDTIAAFNRLFEQQLGQPGRCTFSLVFFGHVPFEGAEDFSPLHAVRQLSRARFVPRGKTPLLDCLGRAIDYTQDRISRMDEANRPDQVIIAVITDGRENSSREYRAEDVRRSLGSQQQPWTCLFVGTHPGTLEDAAAIGIPPARVICCQKTSQEVRDAWLKLSQQISNVRSGLPAGNS